ncbi:hypothetical protein BKA69DRAFT_624364 [Paraphysoderma sedebokerense]|nr:hypothetical protein BKA69DRAFT_624364 [Paraphysoderma sedebokerense]
MVSVFLEPFRRSLLPSSFFYCPTYCQIINTALIMMYSSKIREHSLSTINHILKRSPSPSSMSAIFRLLPTLKLTLFDRSPVVVLSTLHVLSSLLSCITKVESNSIEDELPMSMTIDLINGVSSILKYILDTGLDKNYEYHGVSAPWIQVECLKFLGLAGQYAQHEES